MPRARDPDQYTMSFGEHIEELRKRLIHALLGCGIIMLGTMYYGRTIVWWLFQPLWVMLQLAHLPTQTYTRSTVGGFTVYAKVSLAAAIIISGPWILYQIWRFVEAGLYASERKIAGFLVVLSSVMTVLALAFWYFFFLPAFLAFLIFFTTTYPAPETDSQGFLHGVSTWLVHMNEATFLPGSTGPGDTTAPATMPSALLRVPILAGDPEKPVEGDVWYNAARHEMRFYQGGQALMVTVTTPSLMVPLIDPAEYLTEVSWLALIIVVVFHVPVVLSVLGMTGLVNPDILSKRRKFIVWACFVAAVILTPQQDVFSDIAVPVLMWLLFELGLLFMRFFYNRHHAALEEDKPDAG